MESSIKNLPRERWKIVKLPNDPSNRKRLAISDFGRVKTYSKSGKEGLIKGTLQNGYEIIKLKLFKDRSRAAGKKLVDLRTQLNAMKSKGSKANKQTLATLQKKYKADMHSDELSRMINISYLTHRLVAEQFCKKSPKRELVIHLDFAKRNNKYSNLKWCTQEEVTAHQMKNPTVIKAFKARKGKRPESRTAFKLNETNVISIKRHLAKGLKLSDLAKKFKVSETQIKRIQKGENWGDIKVPKK